VLHDVTHFKELDRIKSDFVATVSHDLKAPITVIYGYVELLEDTLPHLNELALRSLEEIRESATRMKNLITTLLDLAQIEVGLDQANQPCRISEIISDVLKSHRLQAEEKGITLKATVAENLPTVLGHPVRLGQAVTNLVGNALKYTPPGGQVRITADRSDQKIVVQVSDSGPGIPPAKQAGLFGKFYKVGATETRDQEGHGLGLAIVKSVAEAYGGRVWVESAIGQGSTFFFSLPIPEPEE
jgi:signal transduction histidine kinase